jgi:hypothetical protein
MPSISKSHRVAMSSGEAVERYDRVRLKPGILPRYELAGMPLGTWLGDKMTRSWCGSNGCEYPKDGELPPFCLERLGRSDS